MVDLWYVKSSSLGVEKHREAYRATQRIQYAKSKSDLISKLDGSFKIPVYSTSDKAAAPDAAVGDKGTALQQSVFGGGAPPISVATGAKRTREEDDGSDAMEEDEQDMEMDESDDD